MYIYPFENDHLAVALAFKLRHYGIYGSLMLLGLELLKGWPFI
jgi:hypothetical protein